MADDKTDKTADPPGDDKGDDAEAGFWAKFDSRIDEGIERNLRKHSVTGTQRTGRSTLPGMLANIMFGTDKADKS
jgi:hypothetical protein